MFVSCHFLLLPETATKKARTNETQFRHTCFGLALALSCLVIRPCTQHCCCVSVSPLPLAPSFPSPFCYILCTAETKVAEVVGSGAIHSPIKHGRAHGCEAQVTWSTEYSMCRAENPVPARAGSPLFQKNSFGLRRETTQGG